MNTLPDCRARYQKLRPRKDLQSLSTILFPESESGIDIIQVREDINSACARNVCLLQLCTMKTLPRTNIHWDVISPVCGNNLSCAINWRSAVRSTEVASPKLTTQQESAALPHLQERSTMPFSFDMVALKKRWSCFVAQLLVTQTKRFISLTCRVNRMTLPVRVLDT
jgi:hypothetical protein